MSSDKKDDWKVERYGWAKSGVPGELAWLNPNEINLDHDYQRDLNKNKVVDIAREFSWPAFGVIIVARRPDGAYFAPDGQHRIHVARERGEKAVPCIIFDMRERSQEAKVFIDANKNRKPPSMVDKFRAMLVAGDETAIRVDELTRAHGRVPGDKSKAGGVRCLAAVMRWAKNDEATLRRAWPLISTVCQGEQLHEHLVGAVLFIESRSDGDFVLNKKWSKKLLEIGYTRALRAIHEASAYYAKGGERVWASGLLKELNKGRTNKLSVRGVDS